MDTIDILIVVAFSLMSFMVVGAGIAYLVFEYRLKRDRKRQLTPLIGVVLPRSDKDDA